MNQVLFEEYNPDELQKIIKSSGIAFLPLGTLEWHGDHLPFGTDAFISYELSKAVCTKTGGLVIPPLYFGTDREHDVEGKTMHGKDAEVGRILPGSIYFLREDLFYQMLKSIAENIDSQGFKKLVIISAHSGTAQQNVLEKLSREKYVNLKLFVFPGKLFPGGIDHAGKIEASLMMSIRKDLVHLDKLKKPHEGISGEDPAEASEKEGHKHFDQIADKIEKEILAEDS